MKATATLTNAAQPKSVADDGYAPISCAAYAREEEIKKGMDGAQVTGAASSYARKYALNGLFCIDDTKDADTMDNRQETPQKKETPKAPTPPAAPSPAPKAKPTLTKVFESLTAATDLKNLMTLYSRTKAYTWSEKEQKEIDECFKNVEKKFQPAAVPVPKAA